MEDASRWLTYPELAEARGISRLSAERLVRRRKWQRRPGNDGGVRILVPAGEDRPHPDSRPDDRPDGRPDNRPDSWPDSQPLGEQIRAGGPDNRPDDRPDDRVDISHAINALGEAVAVLREQLAAAHGEIQAERQRADRLQAEVTDLRVVLAVERAASRSWLFRLWRGRGG